MTIKQVKQSRQRDFIKISAICKIRAYGEDELYFKVKKKYENFLSLDYSTFAAALLIPSMKVGEDLIIEGPISEELYKGMHKIKEIFLSWGFGLKPINIRAKKILADNNNPTKNAAFFSGGVDSFYTYLKHKKGPGKIDYFILINGFDINLKNQNLWKRTRETVMEVAKQGGVEVITVESNFYDLIDPIASWDYSCGGCLAAIGLGLRKKIKKLYIPSSYRLDQWFPTGSHPETDKLWGTEKLSIIHDGVEKSRLDKTLAISKNPLVLKHLRVCYKNLEGKYNCGVCDKCLRTMVSLEVAGALKNSETFPKKIDIDVIRNMTIVADYSAVFQKENLKALTKQDKNKELRKVLKEKLKNVPKYDPNEPETLARKLYYLDHFYMRGTVRRFLHVL